jgi:phage-related tail protein
MNTSPSTTAKPPVAQAIDLDMADQARPGHGIPSQDPSASAQSPLAPGEAAREAQSVLAGGGMVAGTAAGVAIGSVMAGPVGAVVGGAVGAVAGALGGAASGSLVNADSAAGDDKTGAPSRPSGR